MDNKNSYRYYSGRQLIYERMICTRLVNYQPSRIYIHRSQWNKPEVNQAIAEHNELVLHRESTAFLTELRVIIRGLYLN